jgi:hypothetical protein
MAGVGLDESDVGLGRGVGLRTVRAVRYVMPLREGGSLPAIVESDDLGLYVLKFEGRDRDLWHCG